MAVANRLHAGLDGLGRRWERAVADLQLDDVLSGGIRRLAMARTLNALSTPTDDANRLNVQAYGTTS